MLRGVFEGSVVPLISLHSRTQAQYSVRGGSYSVRGALFHTVLRQKAKQGLEQSTR
jgi:hypothetical protein